jgi:hypothetical protein
MDTNVKNVPGDNNQEESIRKEDSIKTNALNEFTPEEKRKHILTLMTSPKEEFIDSESPYFHYYICIIHDYMDSNQSNNPYKLCIICKELLSKGLSVNHSHHLYTLCNIVKRYLIFKFRNMSINEKFKTFSHWIFEELGEIINENNIKLPVVKFKNGDSK